MSAEVAIMNKQGVAIAADSAVSIFIGKGNLNNKTYYTQQKIFDLSPKHSVGIMIYSESEFMGISWEIIISEFGKAVGDRIFDTLEEYAKYLITFLKDFTYIGDKQQKEYLEKMSWFFYNELKDIYDSKISAEQKEQVVAKGKQIEIISEVIKEINDRLEKEDYSTGFVDDGFVKTNRNIIESQLDEVFSGFNFDSSVKEEMIELFYIDLVKIEISLWLKFNSGIVFAGYGGKEIFPTVVDFRLFGRLGKSIIQTKMNIYDVVNESNSWISPYAQTDVINTFIRGIDPIFKEKITERIDSFIENIKNLTGEKNINKINELKEELINDINEHEFKNYTEAVTNMVSSFPKSNLAEMAEALVNLTALRRHVSNEEEDVGGPTDVALITKVDGFVWIKKKQLFQNVYNNLGS